MSQPPQMRTRKTSFTADELIHLPRGKCRYELVKGELFEMPPAGGRHGSVAMRIGILLGSHVMRNRLGEVFAADTGFIVRRDPDTVRAPDACFIGTFRVRRIHSANNDNNERSHSPSILGQGDSRVVDGPMDSRCCDGPQSITRSTGIAGFRGFAC